MGYAKASMHACFNVAGVWDSLYWPCLSLDGGDGGLLGVHCGRLPIDQQVQ